jgi:hypothetical protein
MAEELSHATNPKRIYSKKFTPTLVMPSKLGVQEEQLMLMHLKQTLRSWRNDLTMPFRSWTTPSTRCERRSRQLSRTSLCYKTMLNSWGTMSLKKPLPCLHSYLQAARTQIAAVIVQALEESIQAQSRDASPSGRVMSQPQAWTPLYCSESYGFPLPLRRGMQVMY